MLHEYKITIEDGAVEDGYQPWTVTVQRLGETREYSGKHIKSLIKRASNWVLADHKESTRDDV